MSDRLPGGDGVASRRSATALRVGVVRNPRSHRNLHRPDDAAGLSEVCVAVPGDTAELQAALARFRDDGVAVLAIDGGDGTVRDVLTCGAAVFGSDWPRLVVLPKGKTNALAVDLGVPRLWSLGDALAAAQAGGSVERRPLVVERDADGQRGTGAEHGSRQDGGAAPPLWGFVLGAGAFNAATDAGQEAHRRGAFQSFAVLVTLISALGSALLGVGDGALRRLSPMRLAVGPGTDPADPVEADRAEADAAEADAAEAGRAGYDAADANLDGANLDGTNLDETDGHAAAAKGWAEVPHGPLGRRGQRYVALFSTLRTLPLGLMPFRRGDRHIRYFVVDAPRRRTLARIPAVLCGAERAGDAMLGIHRGAGRDFVVELAQQGFVLDGEAFPAGRLRLREGPTLRFVVP